MCGIAGLIRLDGFPVERTLVAAMTRPIAHRGPAIIDLATGDQPMASDNAARRARRWLAGT